MCALTVCTITQANSLTNRADQILLPFWQEGAATATTAGEWLKFNLSLLIYGLRRHLLVCIFRSPTCSVQVVDLPFVNF